MELKCLQDNCGIAAEEEENCWRKVTIYRQLDVMGIQIPTLGKWWSLFQLVVNCFGVFSLKNFVVLE